jgi:hypothetical protein
MTTANDSLLETVTLSQAKSLIRCLAHRQSLLLLSPPGVGKSETVAQAAVEAGLTCRSLLGTQIAPEDVSGIPRIVGERSVFCPPRVLLPEEPQPFCLFLDELPACTPDIQKAFYSLLLERRLGEHVLPAGTWVVAAGNRLEDRALVRSLSSALINRVILLQVRVDMAEWLAWAHGHGVRPDVVEFIEKNPAALIRPVPPQPVPFSTPRAWTSLAHALDLAESSGLLTPSIRRALASGRVSKEDAEAYCGWIEAGRRKISPAPPPWELLPLLETAVGRLGLTTETAGRLREKGITTLRGLVARGSGELADVDVEEVSVMLAERGLRLGMDGLPPTTPNGEDLERLLNGSLAELELSVRATNCLESEGLTTVRDLVQRSDDELLEVRNFGETVLKEVKTKLAGRGLYLGML